MVNYGSGNSPAFLQYMSPEVNKTLRSIEFKHMESIIFAFEDWAREILWLI